MTFRFDEKPRSRSSTFRERSATLCYTASGTTDAAFVESYAVLNTAPMYNGLYRQDVIVDATASDMFDVTVPYGPAPLMGNYRLSCDTTGGTIHVSASRSTVSAYGTRLDGSAAETSDNQQMIGVNQDSVDGTDIVIPAMKLTVNFQHDQGIVTLARMKQLARATGQVNSDTFLTFAPGEVLFLGMTCDEGSNTPTSVAYQFACSQNVTGLTIGSISNIVKAGWDYAWIHYKDAIVGQTPVKRPMAVYVERLYSTTSFVPLFGFGG